MKTLKIDKSWTIFLDRDGVINKRLIADYVKNIGEFEILDGVEEAIAFFKKQFQKVVVVTNQQGIGRGLMTEGDLNNIHNHLQDKLKPFETQIDAFYYCSKIASEPNNCRKPNPQMGYWAKEQFPSIDFNKSLMVGDSISDMEFGKNLGMKTVFITVGKKENNFTDYYTTSLATLASLLK